MTIRLASVIAVTILALSGVGAAVVSDPQGGRVTIVLAFLAPTIVALLALARVEDVKSAQVRLNGEVTKLQSHLARATDVTQQAADRVEHAVEELPPPSNPE